MPSVVPIFKKKLDDKQVIYFIWPKLFIWKKETYRLVTGNETWLHFYEPTTSLQCTQWKRNHEATPIRPKVVPSAGKRMATVFWDMKG